MIQRLMSALAVLVAVGAWVTAMDAQRPDAQRPAKANWLTDGYDPQRTSWQRNETLISPATLKDMRLVWKLQLDNQPRQLHNLYPPLIVSDVRNHPVGA